MATKSLIPVVGKLQDVFATIGNRENEIQLPQIVVVGSQSSGKSSVIEGLVGRDFLPRGNGIVTRRPLLIHLTPMPINDPKRLGIVGVVNRSQADINSKKPMEECLKDEVTFLRRKYPAIASKNGIRFLEKSLNSLLLNHIRKNLPEVALRIAKLKSEYQTTMLSYGEPITDKSALLLDALTSFSNNFNSLINGTVVSKSSELIGGARIREIFYEKFGASLEEINPLEGLSNEMIIGNIRNANGTKSFFVPQVSFEILIKEQMKLLDESSLKCVDLVYEELLRMIQHCGGEIQKEMQRFPRLYERMIQVFSTLLRSQISPTKEFIKNFLEIQKAHINTNHPDFASTTKKNGTNLNNGWFFDVPDCKEEADYDYDERIASFVECKIRRYFDIVMKLIQDSVPKAIMKFLVHKVRDELRNELLRNLYQKNMDYLLCENEFLAQHRKETSEMLDALTKADEIINGIREIYQVGDIVENGGENVTDVLQVANATEESDNVINEIRETGNFGEYIKLLAICVCFILFFLIVKFFTL